MVFVKVKLSSEGKKGLLELIYVIYVIFFVCLPNSSFQTLVVFFFRTSKTWFSLVLTQNEELLPEGNLVPVARAWNKRIICHFSTQI